ncbi:heavy metal translocating P-type ATPase [Simiduia curdlanivorans]|uniref:Heavy metal translocating P-type ATPase n=1 Tax=Simiduia curdlanivorans TaxID=1492769 RepID=A0ABV8V2V4_9GAMM|nr:heavy metal translocating P-type ATPase [Simiduia curdlanivorans]MDN3640982.1 heavy metal translocating P-type ATPase [Simiduia curdlanivorans]
MADIPCYHCNLPTPEPAEFFVLIEGESRPMCCPGCQAIASAIVDGGLSSFYRYRTESNARPEAHLADYSAYDLADLQADFVTGETAQRSAFLLLDGLTCAACVWLIEKHLYAIDGVLKVSVNATNHRLTLVFNSAKVQLSSLMFELDRIGYRPMPANDENQRDLWQKTRNALLMRLAVAGFGMMQVMMVAIALYAGALQDFEGIWQSFFRWVSLIVATPVVLFSAQPFFRAAFNSLKQHQLVMDVPVALAIGGAYLASAFATVTATGEVYFESVSMFTFFLLLGRYLELRLRHKNASSLRSVGLRLPLTARRQRAGDEHSDDVISIKQLIVGDRVRVLAGETLPCDGVVVDGTSHVDEALITGESDAVKKTIGSQVIAGSINLDSQLSIRAEAVGRQTQLSAIEQLVARAESDKPQQVNLADRLARFFVARLLVVAALVAGFWLWYQPEQAFWVTLSVLVVTCPCALSLATPVALTRATLWLREKGLLVTRGHVVEALARVDTVVFDKTGTLTQGKLALLQLQPLSEALNGADMQAIVAALEAGSRHPIAKAFESIPAHKGVTDLVQYPSQGVEGRLEGQVIRFGRADFFRAWYGDDLPAVPEEKQQWYLLGSEAEPLAWFELRDALREDAIDTIERLKKRGLGVLLLSGDRQAVVSQLAQTLAIDEAQGDLLPKDKLARVQQLQQQGHTVLMVGDGINDVPVLAGADVSVAMAGATDLAQVNADTLLTHGRLGVLIDSLALALECKRTIKQNLTWAIAYNLIALPFAAMGWVPPYVAAAGMSLSSLIVVINAMGLDRKLKQ